jgi:hypothetical protein
VRRRTGSTERFGAHHHARPEPRHPPTPTPDATPEPQGDPDGLGDAGKRALQAERTADSRPNSSSGSGAEQFEAAAKAASRSNWRRPTSLTAELSNAELAIARLNIGDREGATEASHRTTAAADDEATYRSGRGRPRN